MMLLLRLLLILFISLSGVYNGVHAASCQRAGTHAHYFPVPLSEHRVPNNCCIAQAGKNGFVNLPRSLGKKKARKVCVIDNEEEDEEPAGFENNKDDHLPVLKPVAPAGYFAITFCAPIPVHGINTVRQQLYSYPYSSHCFPYRPYILFQVFRI